MQSKLRLLLVDDEEAIRRALRKVLERRGVQVVAEASDGAEGLSAFQEGDCDVVLTDLKMPNMDGIELTREIKKIDPVKPVVVFSAYSDASLVAEGIEAGATKWLTKGCPPTELVAALHDAAGIAPPA